MKGREGSLLHRCAHLLHGLCRNFACLALEVVGQLSAGLLGEGGDGQPKAVACLIEPCRGAHEFRGRVRDPIWQLFNAGEEGVQLTQHLGDQDFPGRVGTGHGFS